MQFGKVEASGMNYTLPPDHPGNASILKGKAVKDPEMYIGFPIFTHPKWVGTIYPPKTKSDALLHYAKQYNSIELNATRYKIDPMQVKAWKNMVPPGFRFCPKVTEFISNASDLPSMTGAFKKFIETASLFGENLGCPFLLQPVYFKPNRMDALIRLLDAVPDDFELAVEVRHEEWFVRPESLDDLAAYLSARKMILIITDAPGRRDVLHQRLTASSAFIRFTGNNLDPSDFSRLDDWVNRLSEWMDQGLRKFYFFVHSPQKHFCPELTYHFIQQLNLKRNIQLPLPKRLFEKNNNALFD
jgi:uncharacterized protein YecE (DUF72 family)